MQQMATSSSFIIKYRNNYYDISQFLHKHPGGTNTLMGLQNDDITKRFLKPPLHSDAAMYLMEEYKIPVTESKSSNLINGKTYFIESIDNEANNSDERSSNLFDEQMEHLVDWSKAMLPQIPRISQYYGEWVHKPVDRPLTLLTPWFLEIFTKTPWWLVPVFWIPIITKLMYDELISELAAHNFFKFTLFIVYFLTGIIVWTFLEYTLHRFVFHIKIKPTTHPWLCTFHFMVHGLHHKVPFDPLRLVFPPLPGALVATILYIPLALFLPQPRVILAGGLLGYLCYDMIHYYLHNGRPTAKHLYHMKRYHYQHHFARQDLGYGISSEIWDFVFNTRIHLRKLRFRLNW